MKREPAGTIRRHWCRFGNMGEVETKPAPNRNTSEKGTSAKVIENKAEI